VLRHPFFKRIIMKKYSVYLELKIKNTFEIEAENSIQAKEKAINMAHESSVGEWEEHLNDSNIEEERY
jgi:hypothetical protein